MLNPPDVRFKSSGRQLAQARVVLFPIGLRVLRPVTIQALAEVRRLVDQLRRAAEELEVTGGKVTVLDPDTIEGREVSTLIIQQKSAREVSVQLSFAVSLMLDDTDVFWAHASAIAATADLIQAFGQRPHEKGVEVDIEQARTSDPKPNSSSVSAVSRQDS